MAFWVFEAFDRPGRERDRRALRPAHRAYLREAPPECRCVGGGPLLNDDGGEMIGTLLILEAETRAAAEAFLAKDPYAQADLFARHTLSRWDWTLRT